MEPSTKDRSLMNWGMVKEHISIRMVMLILAIGKMISLTDKEPTSSIQQKGMKVSFSMEKSKVKESICIRMGIDIKAHGKMTKKMDMVCLHISWAMKNMKETGWMAKSLVMAHIILQMEKNMWDNGIRTKRMGKEYTIILLEQYLREFGSKIRLLVREQCSIPIKRNMMESLRMDWDKELELINSKTVQDMNVSGKMTKRIIKE